MFGRTGKMSAIDDVMENLKQMMGDIKDIYRAHTGLDEAELEALLKRDLWWKTDKCLAKGLIDAVWDGEDPGAVKAAAGQDTSESRL